MLIGMHSLLALLLLSSACFAQQINPKVPMPEQMEAVRRTEARRYIRVVAKERGGVLCEIWGIGGSKDPQVVAFKKEGRKLKQYKTEFLYPLVAEPRGYEYGIVKGILWGKAEMEMVTNLYLVRKGGGRNLWVYAASLSEAAKLLAEP